MPLSSPRLEAGREASSSISSSSASRSSEKPCTSASGSSARRIAATARLRIVPPIPTSRPPRPHQPSASSSVSTCLRSALSALAGAFSPGRNCSLTRTEPSGSDSASASRRPASRMTWMLPPPMSSPKPSSIVVELAIASQP